MNEIKEQLSTIITSRKLYDIINVEKELEWIIPNLIIKGSINLIYGSTGSGKSAFCHSLAFYVSQGISFGWYQPNKSKVLYIDGDLSVLENKSRWKKIISSLDDNFDIDIETLAFYLSEDAHQQTGDYINLYDKNWQYKLDSLFEKFDLIFLDNLSCLFFPSEKDPDYENKASVWLVIGNWIRTWKERGKSFIIIHESNKGEVSRGSFRLDIDTMTQIKLTPLLLKTEEEFRNIALRFQVSFDKCREIVGEWRRSFIVQLGMSNEWRFISNR